MTTTAASKAPSLSALARSNNFVTIDVGPEHQIYKVHAELIAHYSGYFKGALNGSWKEAQDRTVELSDVEPYVFDIFVDWLYSQRLPWNTADWLPQSEYSDHEHGRQRDLLLVKCCVFADRFIVPRLRVQLYTHYANYCNIGTTTTAYYSAIIYAFENLPPTSSFLSLLVKLQCGYWTEATDTKKNGELMLRQDLPHEFLVRCMIQSSKMRDDEKAKAMLCCPCLLQTAPSEPEREGCDTCNPLPSVKKKKSAQQEASSNETPTDGDVQGEQTDIPNNNDNQTQQPDAAANANQAEQGNDQVDNEGHNDHHSQQTDNTVAAVQGDEQTDQSNGILAEVVGPSDQTNESAISINGEPNQSIQESSEETVDGNNFTAAETIIPPAGPSTTDSTAPNEIEESSNDLGAINQHTTAPVDTTIPETNPAATTGSTLQTEAINITAEIPIRGPAPSLEARPPVDTNKTQPETVPGANITSEASSAEITQPNDESVDSTESTPSANTISEVTNAVAGDITDTTSIATIPAAQTQASVA